MSGLRDLSRLRRLSAPEFWGLATAVVMSPLIALALRIGGLRRVQEAIARLPTRPPAVTRLRLSPMQVERLAAVAARRGPGTGNCMVRSLTLQWLLARQGHPSLLRIGVRKASQGLEAHAWVEVDGQPLVDAADVDRIFPPFDPILPHTRR